jgi:hypothetical protein
MLLLFILRKKIQLCRQRDTGLIYNNPHDMNYIVHDKLDFD